MLSRQSFVQTLTFCRQDSRVLLKAVLIFALLIKVWGQEAMHEKGHLSDLMRQPVNNTPLASIAGWSYLLSMTGNLILLYKGIIGSLWDPHPPPLTQQSTSENWGEYKRSFYSYFQRVGIPLWFIIWLIECYRQSVSCETLSIHLLIGRASTDKPLL